MYPPPGKYKQFEIFTLNYYSKDKLTHLPVSNYHIHNNRYHIHQECIVL